MFGVDPLVCLGRELCSDWVLPWEVLALPLYLAFMLANQRLARPNDIAPAYSRQNDWLHDSLPGVAQFVGYTGLLTAA